MLIYEFHFRFDLGQAVTPVGELANQLNSNLSRMGCDEKVAITSEFPALLLKSNRKLTVAELQTVKKIVTEQMQAAFPTWNVQLTSLSRKPGNVQQSVEQ